MPSALETALAATRAAAFVAEDLQLHASLASTAAALDADEQREVLHQARAHLRARGPFVEHLLEARLVRSARRNFLNVRVRHDFVTMMYHFPRGAQLYCFMMSDKLEPFVVVTVLDAQRGKLAALSAAQVADLEAALGAFCTHFGIRGETYHYTSLRERQAAGGVATRQRAHSLHFHLKMRVDPQMMLERIPALQVLAPTVADVQAWKGVDAVRHQFDRPTRDWAATRELILEDAGP